SAALTAARLGRRVILTEETDWIGGQLTAQGVPPDEHPWIEQTGCTQSYRRFRDAVRDYYRTHFPLLAEARATAHLNPGNGWVGSLCHEPRVGVAVLEEMIAHYREEGRLKLMRRHRPVAAEIEGDRIAGVSLEHTGSGDRSFAHAPFILDATELGDLLALGRVEHVIGSESQTDTGELHALEVADPLDQQAVTWCFALEYLPGEDHTIERPKDYDFWCGYRGPSWPGPQLGWNTLDPETLAPRMRPLFFDPPGMGTAEDLWCFRRIRYCGHFLPGSCRSDITLVNWPQNDYSLKALVGVTEEERQEALEGARRLSLSLLYWMQTQAPRPEGAYGYPGLKPHGEAVGTSDGFAKSVYIREARRLKATTTVTEQHVGVEARRGLTGAQTFADSVGVGAYRIDLHPSTRGRGYVDLDSWPFQIPLGALIPVRVDNLLAAGKNIGTTHITNGCYRLHPVEWNIGEAAGALAAYCIERKVEPRAVLHDTRHLSSFRGLLRDVLGVQLAWPTSIAETPVIPRNPI
ncbi:MAG: FAD-dependent oxidoreductase, partial [Actinomycetota bacterium]|nr:FAD-dependent oxidoreductase [Actinomycetota bacterium]